MRIRFNLKNYPSEHDAYLAFDEAQSLLASYNIDFKTDIHSSDLYVTTEFTGKMVYGRTYTIIFKSDEDYNTYLIIKD